MSDYWQMQATAVKNDVRYSIEHNAGLDAYRCIMTTPDHSRYLGEFRAPTYERACELARKAAR